MTHDAKTARGFGCAVLGMWLALAGAGGEAVRAADEQTVAAPLPAEAYMPDEVLVLSSADGNGNGKLDAGETFANVSRSIPGRVMRQTTISPTKRVLRVKLPAGKSVKAAMAEHWGKGDARILAVEPNYIVHRAGIPSDTRFGEQWGLHNIGQFGGMPDADIDAPEAWDVTTGSTGVIVALLDGGADYLHPDLTNNVWRNPGESGGGRESNGIDDDGNGFVDDVYGFDFYQDDNDPSDADGHGTHVAGIVGAQGDNAMGVSGVSRQCRLMICRFLDASGNGLTSDAIDAVNYAVANGARVINNSWVGGGYSAALEAAIANARDQGVLFVAAAGNTSSDNDVITVYPAGYEVSNVIAVAATTRLDGLATFSNYGAGSVKLGAPGTEILSTDPVFETLFYEDFQGATVPSVGTQFTTQGPVSRWGTVNNAVTTGNIAARGDFANSQPYAANTDGSLVSPPINTTGRRGLRLGFNIRVDCAVGDALDVDASNNDGAWQNLTRFSIIGFFPPAQYSNVLLDVPDALRGPATRFRWRWVTDAVNNNFRGVEIDDIEVSCLGNNYGTAYDYREGTSMAAPHVSGVAALLLATNPAMSLTELTQRLVVTGDPLASLAGVTSSGRRVNAHKALTATPQISVVSPNGGQAWPRGRMLTLSWVAIGAQANVQIQLLKGGALSLTVAASAPNTGTFNWAIPSNLAPGGDYRIRITDGTLTDTSDADFSIIDPVDAFTQQFTSGSPFDLSGRSITFAPGGPAGYTACLDNILQLPTDPTGGAALSLGDDGFMQVNVTGGNTVKLYGVAYSSVFVNSNGYITFGQPDSSFTETLPNHFKLPRISALFNDLDPSAGGSVIARQLGDRMTMTWLQVPEFFGALPNTFQVEMFFDGTIRLSWLTLSASEGVVGLSQGLGLPPGFVQSDLSANTSCSERSVVSWRSLRSHTNTGDLGLVLNPAASGNGASGPTVETRSGGIQKIEVAFDAPITLLNPLSVLVAGRTTAANVMGPEIPYVPTSVTVSGTDKLVLAFAPNLLPQDTCYRIVLLPGLLAQTIVGDADCNVRCNFGDVNMNGEVNIGDTILVRTQLNSPATTSPHLDVNISGGLINIGDAITVKTRLQPVHRALCP